MSKGYVYILSNPWMPGLVKIGKTTRSVEARALEIFTTGVPVPFKVEECAYSPDCHELEAIMHEELAECRVMESREFFAVDPHEAAWLLERRLAQQVAAFVNEFLPDHIIVQSDMALDAELIDGLAVEISAHPVEIVSSLNSLTLADVAPVFERWKARIPRA